MTSYSSLFMIVGIGVLALAIIALFIWVAMLSSRLRKLTDMMMGAGQPELYSTKKGDMAVEVAEGMVPFDAFGQANPEAAMAGAPQAGAPMAVMPGAGDPAMAGAVDPMAMGVMPGDEVATMPGSGLSGTTGFEPVGDTAANAAAAAMAGAAVADNAVSEFDKVISEFENIGQSFGAMGQMGAAAQQTGSHPAVSPEQATFGAAQGQQQFATQGQQPQQGGMPDQHAQQAQQARQFQQGAAAQQGFDARQAQGQQGQPQQPQQQAQQFQQVQPGAQPSQQFPQQSQPMQQGQAQQQAQQFRAAGGYGGVNPATSHNKSRQSRKAQDSIRKATGYDKFNANNAAMQNPGFGGAQFDVDDPYDYEETEQGFINGYRSTSGVQQTTPFGRQTPTIPFGQDKNVAERLESYTEGAISGSFDPDSIDFSRVVGYRPRPQ